MYSEALRILDQNTVELMVELQQGGEIKALRGRAAFSSGSFSIKELERRLRVRYSSPRISFPGHPQK